MADLVIVTVTLGFIAVCVGYVGWCDRIMRTDEPAPPVIDERAAR